MKRDFKGVFIPAYIWCADYDSFEDRETAIFTYIAKTYGIEVATAGGIKDGK